MKKKAISLMGILISLSLTTSVFGNVKVFKDVNEEDWFYKPVLKAYSLGLLNGKTDTTYSPKDNMTYAEAIKLSAVMNQLYKNGSITLNKGEDIWYMPFYDYCIKEGIITEEYGKTLLSRINENITREEYIYIFGSSLPSDAFTVINNISDNQIPDVKSDGSDLSEAIYKLYRSGIITGNDESLVFYPKNNIMRSEVASVVSRMMDKTMRIKLEDKGENTSYKDLINTMDKGGYSLGISYVPSLDNIAKDSPIGEIPLDRLVDCGGDEIYAIVPKNIESKVFVYEWIINEKNDYKGEIGREVYSSNKGEAFLLKCNISDIMPNSRVVIVDNKGERLEFTPSISLKDGLLYVDNPKGIYDFSVENNIYKGVEDILGSWRAVNLKEESVGGSPRKCVIDLNNNGEMTLEVSDKEGSLYSYTGTYSYIPMNPMNLENRGSITYELRLIKGGYKEELKGSFYIGNSDLYEEGILITHTEGDGLVSGMDFIPLDFLPNN